jgi:DNA-binding NarL/FixJ family response regulator
LAQESSPRATAQFSAYNELVAEYCAAVKRCEAHLDELAAAERQLRAYTAAMNGHVPPYAVGASDVLRSELAKYVSAAPTISDRERQVFELIGKGFKTAQISEELSLALSTVETYRERLKQKLNLPDANALLREAVLWVAGNDPQRELLPRIEGSNEAGS